MLNLDLNILNLNSVDTQKNLLESAQNIKTHMQSFQD